MARKLTLRVEPSRPPKEKRWYSARVREVRKPRGKKQLDVTLECTHPDCDGHRCAVRLPLPVRTHGLAAEFFKACGLNVNVGQSIAPGDAVGRIVRAMYGEQDGRIVVIAFQQSEGVAPHGQSAR